MSALAALALALAPGLQGERRLARLEVELDGPLAGLAVELAPFARAELALSLVAGERRRALVPLAAPLEGAPPRPLLAPSGGGSARVLGWSEVEERPLAATLAARPLPPVAPRAPRARALAWPLLALALVAAWSLRRRPALALAAGLAGALALAAAGARPGASGRVRVLDGDGARPLWLLTDGAPEALALDPRGAHAGARLAVRPQERVLVARASARGDEPPAWTLEAGPGASLWARAPFERGPHGFRSEDGAEPGPATLVDAWGPIEAAWWRTADGAWREGGAWEPGEPLLAALARAGEGPAPGWLAAGLPPGVEVLLARLAPGSWAGPGGGGSPCWIRLTRPGRGP